jgi:hypothetical protein
MTLATHFALFCIHQASLFAVQGLTDLLLANNVLCSDPTGLAARSIAPNNGLTALSLFE